MRGTVFGLLVWAGIVGGPVILLGMFGCAEKTKKQKAETEFTEFCSANNATPAFKGLPDSDLLMIDLQRSLFVKEKRAAFKAQLSELYRSEKRGTMMAYLLVSYGDAEIPVYLQCTDSQAQELHDGYQKNKNSTLLVVAQFDEVEAKSKSDSGSDSDYNRAYSAVGTLVLSKVSEYTDKSDSKSASDSD